MTLLSLRELREAARGLFREHATPPVVSPGLVQGIVRRNGGLLYLVTADFPVRGVKLVTVPSALLLKYAQAWAAMDAVQRELESLPATLRPRKRYLRSSGAADSRQQPPGRDAAVRDMDDKPQPSPLSQYSPVEATE